MYRLRIASEFVSVIPSSAFTTESVVISCDEAATVTVEIDADRLPDAQPAFEIWRSTDLDTYRLTSAIELYRADGRLTSRFALRLPQTVPENLRGTSCDWDFLDEVSPIGSSERHVLRASRALCERGRRLGSIVVRVMLDYRTLPFIRVESPYMASQIGRAHV